MGGLLSHGLFFRSNSQFLGLARFLRITYNSIKSNSLLFIKMLQGVKSYDLRAVPKSDFHGFVRWFSVGPFRHLMIQEICFNHSRIFHGRFALKFS